jgi:hypothetical protein
MTRTAGILEKFALAQSLRPDIDRHVLKHAIVSGASVQQAASLFLDAVLRIRRHGDGLDPESPFFEKVPAGASAH